MSAQPSFEFEAIGEPVGKQRPRASMAGGHPRVYTPRTTLSYEQSVRSAYMAKYGCVDPISRPIRIVIEAYFGLNKGDYTPKGALSKRGKAKLDGFERHTKTPDFDNVAKAVVDALNGVAYTDDSLIYEATVRKGYAKVPHVRVLAYADD